MDYSVVLVELMGFSTAERILSYEIPHLMMQAAHLT